MPKSPMVLGAVVFPGFKMLDLFGPLEMFSGKTRRADTYTRLQIAIHSLPT